MTRRIAIVTGSRAEYGLLRPVISWVQAAVDLELQLIVTGMHLSPEFGSTWREIEEDGVPIAARVEMLLGSDSAVGVTKSTGLGMIGFADTFATLKPDLVVVLGDRFEILAAATAAMLAAIPIAHLHGGETTEGAFDEAIRHAVTKMAQLHFVAARPYRDRVVQLGEAPERVFEVGGLGVDAIGRVERLSRGELERDLGIDLGGRNLLVTFHPVTLEPDAVTAQFTTLLDALDACEPDATLIFTMPNADTGGRELMQIIDSYVAASLRAHAFASLGQRRYFSLLAQVDAVIGNSSSGLLEAPSFHIGTLDIGDRQAGRLKADSVISCAPDREAIVAGLRRLRHPDFKASLSTVVNPYGSGGAGAAIVEVLRSVKLNGLVKKRFYDLPTNKVTA
ncbi:MAG: UDP-N-acetylglucosamine 2-epimerase (hydrolyzing) [Oxalobacteraceae bacterium]|nr:MAG: UDP-N-acetylglucosamine 2-epimerase (hydrolyzing) [Oxalobacteraceae bacterium]